MWIVAARLPDQLGRGHPVLERNVLDFGPQRTREHDVGEFLIMEEVANALLVAAEEGIDLRNVLDVDAGGRCECQRGETTRIAHRKLRRHPAAQRLPDQMDAVEIKLF